MENCQKCGAILTHVEGRKQKSFCNTNCRNKYFYNKNKGAKKVEVKETKADPPATPEVPVNEPQTTSPDISEQISELQKEIATLGTGAVGNARRKFLQNKIWELKQNI